MGSATSREWIEGRWAEMKATKAKRGGRPPTYDHDTLAGLIADYPEEGSTRIRRRYEEVTGTPISLKAVEDFRGRLLQGMEDGDAGDEPACAGPTDERLGDIPPGPAWHEIVAAKLNEVIDLGPIPEPGDDAPAGSRVEVLQQTSLAGPQGVAPLPSLRRLGSDGQGPCERHDADDSPLARALDDLDATRRVLQALGDVPADRASRALDLADDLLRRAAV
jgi:hypothetical protein